MTGDRNKIVVSITMFQCFRFFSIKLFIKYFNNPHNPCTCLQSLLIWLVCLTLFHAERHAVHWEIFATVVLLAGHDLLPLL